MSLDPKLPLRIAVSETPLDDMTRHEIFNLRKNAPPEKCYPAIFNGMGLQYIHINSDTSAAKLQRARDALDSKIPAQPNSFDQQIEAARLNRGRANCRKLGWMTTTIVGFAFGNMLRNSNESPQQSLRENIGYVCLTTSALAVWLTSRASKKVSAYDEAYVRFKDEKANYFNAVQNRIGDLLHAHKEEQKKNPWRVDVDLDPN